MQPFRFQAGAVLPTPPTFWYPEEPASVLLLPGLNNSGPGHWQSRWERLPGFSRVDLGDWEKPRLHHWVERLDQAIGDTTGPVVLAAHSLGCLAVAWWSALKWHDRLEHKVRGAVLVAPPDVDAVDAHAGLRDFRPAPRLRLPFTSLLVASRDDHYASFRRSAELARAWSCTLVDAGEAGHLNADSGLGAWPTGLRLVSELSGHDAPALMAQATPLA